MIFLLFCQVFLTKKLYQDLVILRYNIYLFNKLLKKYGLNE